jgi:Flp pilus assembly protein CpaB
MKALALFLMVGSCVSGGAGAGGDGKPATPPLPHNHRAVAVKITGELPPVLAPGSRVDLVMEFDDETKSTVVYRNLLVLAIDTQPRREIVTVAMSRVQTEAFGLFWKHNPTFRVQFQAKGLGAAI